MGPIKPFPSWRRVNGRDVTCGGTWALVTNTDDLEDVPPWGLMWLTKGMTLLMFP